MKQTRYFLINLKKTCRYGAIIAMCYTSNAYADIYSYIDENGTRHLMNHPRHGAELVMRTPSIGKNRVENVRALLDQPRFTSTATMQKRFDTFQGNYPKPLALRMMDPSEEKLLRQLNVAPTLKKNLFVINKANQELYRPYIDMIAEQVNIDPALLHAVISAESAFHVRARSHVGAMGLMQLMPATAKRFGVDDAYDPYQNIRAGARYLRWLLDRFGDVSLAVAGYNAGEGAVEKYNRTIPPYKETRGYVPKVLNYYKKYAAELYGRDRLHQ